MAKRVIRSGLRTSGSEASPGVRKRPVSPDISDVVDIVRAGADSWARDVYGLRMVDRFMRPVRR